MKSEPMVGGFKEGYVKLAPFGPAVNGLAQQKARDAISRIVSGNLRVFQGPLVDNKGVQRVARGEILDVRASSPWTGLVEGVHAASETRNGLQVKLVTAPLAGSAWVWSLTHVEWKRLSSQGQFRSAQTL